MAENKFKKEIRHLEKVDETLTVFTHPCGLEIHIITKPDFSSKQAYFFTKYGALHSSFRDVEKGKDIVQPLGIAHFLEHKLFENPENGIFERFSSLGASVNAFTNFVSTAYTFSTVDNFYKSLHELVDFVQKPHLTEENVEKEKPIIVQEIKMYEDNADWVCYFNTLKNMYINHPIKYDIAGTCDSVNSISVDDLLYAYNSFYAPENMGIVVVGDVDVDEVYKVVDNALTQEYMSRKYNVEVEMPHEPEHVRTEYVEEFKSISKPNFILGFKGKGDDSSLKKTISQRLILDCEFGRGSEFYLDAYEKGILNGTFSTDSTSGPGYNSVLFSAETDQIQEAVDLIKEKLDSIHDKGINKELFELSRRKMMGRFIASFNSTNNLAKTYLTYLIKGYSLFEYINVLTDITPDKALEMLDISRDNFTLSVVKKGSE